MKVDLDIIENEHLIGKLKLLELQNNISPFKNTSEPNVERRISQAISKIPKEYQEAAMALFGNVTYITEKMLTDSWRYLWNEVKRNYNCEIQDVLLLELDRDQLRDDFYRANLIPGRLEDNVPWRSTHDIIDTLINLEKETYSDFLKESFLKIINKKVWIILVDLSISGVSVISEIERVKKIIELISISNKPKLITLIQIVTEDAITKLNNLSFEFKFGINIPLNCALNSEKYGLIKENKLIVQAKELCKWFADTYVLPSDFRLSQMSTEKNDNEIAIFGFDKRGWNIVTYKNTPNNSLPLLWFRPADDKYLPPFERIDSRIGESWKGRREFINKLDSDRKYREKLKLLLDLLKS